MHVMGSWLRRPLVLVTIALILTGCMKLDVTTVIDSDGSGTTTMIVGIARSAQMGLDSLYYLRVQAEQEGAMVNRWEDEYYTGYEIVYEFADLDEMARQLEVQSGELGIGMGNAVTAYKEGGRFYLTIRSEGEPSLLPMQHDASYSVIMPGPIVSYAPEARARVPEPNQVVWTLDLNNPNYELSAVGEARSRPRLPCSGLVPGAMVIAAVLLGRRPSQSSGWL